ncbi:NUDIX domain-containing protein [Crassaminicella indica]|uniref:NUDIX domain-containing protein n=1 Tax=Crassaminicella indica TaxID=2855394 RepID=A0ABX8RFQ1_9CLOT|nr:NUDIX domain-containing protein [Crassaminicella indica]QXM06550.1 NUDIX domain-containing protein [Crassaminicella indica]
MQVFDKCCAVFIIKNNKILLGLRTDGQGWSMAGGKLENGEKHEAAAKREMQEEFNIIAKKLQYLGTVKSIAYVKGVKSFVQPKVFLCCSFEGEPKPQLCEMKELRWFGLDELKYIKLFEPTKAVLKKYMNHLFD